jgi:hypothetical protein
MTPEAETILLSKITTLLDDLRREGTENGEAMFLLGSAAANFVDMGKTQTWGEFKKLLTPSDIIQLLQAIDSEGNRMLDEDKVNFAYALQIIGMTLAASNAEDPNLREGASLLDVIIEKTLTNFRNYAQSPKEPAN